MTDLTASPIPEHVEGVLLQDLPRRAEYMPVESLVPAVRNAKDHDQAAMGASFRAFGALEPVVLDERTGRLIGGHGRIEWLSTAEAQGVPSDWGKGEAWPPEGVWVDDLGRWCWLVTRGFTSRDDAHADAAGLALNRVGERGGWINTTLAEMLDDLRESPMLAAAGFSVGDVDDLMAQLRPPDLDALAEKYGDPDPQQLWPVLRFKVSPQSRDRYLRLVEGVEGGDDVLFDHLLDRAERE